MRFYKLYLFAESPDKFGTFDTFFCDGNLHHLILKLDQILKILREITTQSGGMALIEPNFLNPYCAFIFGTKAFANGPCWSSMKWSFVQGSCAVSSRDRDGTHIQLQTRDFLVPGLPAQRRCCRTLSGEDSHRESMRLDGPHEQVITHPLSNDELVQLHCIAAQARVAADLAGQGDDLARAA